ncbi:cytochrome P450 3A7 [Biomphalaria glabrata]|nr:cytochrome P450 3A7 [Biomphalaria glabrata]
MYQSWTYALNEMDVTSWLIALLVILLLLFAFVHYMTSSHGTFQKLGIDIPPKSPVLGHFGHALKYGVFDVQTVFYQKFKDKKVYGWYDTRTPVLVVKDLDMIKDILVKHFNSFVDRRVFMEHDVPFRDNLLTLRGDRWKHVRSSVSPTFSSGRIKKMSPHIERNAKILLENLKEKQESGQEVELKEICEFFALDTIASIAFGIDINTLKKPENKFAQEIKKITNPNPLLLAIVFLFPFLGPWFTRIGLPFFPKKSMNYLASAVDSVMAERKRDGTEGTVNDFLDLVTSEAQEQGVKERLSLSEIHAQSIIFIFGGLETVSTVMSFTLFLLAVHPECLERAQKEVDEKIGKDFPCSENVQNLHYLDMCINEAIRMVPPAFFLDRQCVESIDINGVHIPKGMVVLIPVYAIHNDPNFWPEPEKFDPERFTPENKETRHPYAFFPFGHGPRNCIGMRLALMELKIAIAAVLQRYTLVPCSKTVYPFHLSKIRARTTNGTWVKINPRK